MAGLPAGEGIPVTRVSNGIVGVQIGYSREIGLCTISLQVSNWVSGPTLREGWP